MKCYQNFTMFDTKALTPTPTVQNLTDQMKPLVQKSEKKQNFDIILNKYFNNEELTDIQLQQLSQHQKIAIDTIKTKSQQKKKRPDQYQKLFYKKSFKYAQLTFFKKNKKNKSRRMSQFYHYHFDKVATSYEVPLINFYHPDKKTKPGLKTGQKSFNLGYIKLILKSKSFKGICKQYHSIFRKECIHERNNKIRSLVTNLVNLIQKNKQDKQKTKKFLLSSKCKIPWTNKDIHQAWQRASEDLSSEPDQNSQNSMKNYYKQEKVEDLMFLQDQLRQNHKYQVQIQYLEPTPERQWAKKNEIGSELDDSYDSIQKQEPNERELKEQFEMMQF